MICHVTFACFTHSLQCRWRFGKKSSPSIATNPICPFSSVSLNLYNFPKHEIGCPWTHNSKHTCTVKSSPFHQQDEILLTFKTLVRLLSFHYTNLSIIFLNIFPKAFKKAWLEPVLHGTYLNNAWMKTFIIRYTNRRIV